MENSWAVINSKENIPKYVIERTIKITKNRLVIDFGSGKKKHEHINFFSKAITRWDEFGVVHCSQEYTGISIEEIINLNLNEKFVLVFLRSISVLSQNDILYLQKLLATIRPRLDYAVVYDYMYNEARSLEYSFIDGVVGKTAKVHVEWWKDGFYHYSDKQLENIFGHSILEKKELSIPAVKRLDDIGTLSIFRFN